MARNPHFRVDELSDEARRIARDGLDRNQRESRIIANIRTATGERISTSSFNRYACWYRVQIRRRELVLQQTEVGVETALKHGAKMTEGIRAELLQTLYEAAREGGDGSASALKQTPPFLIGKLALSFAENDRKERELAERKRTNDINERKTAALEARQKAIDEKLKKAKERVALNPEEAVKAIDDLYGLTQ